MIDMKSHVSNWRVHANKRVLVVGANSLVGSNLAISLAQRIQVDALVAQPTLDLPGCHMICCDPSDLHLLATITKRQQPTWIVLCGPLARSSWDPPPNIEAEREVVACRWWARLAKRLSIRLTMLSSDAVFSGPRMFHREESPANAKGAFASAVRQAEESVRSTGSLVVRSHTFGWSRPGIESGVVERVWESLIEGDACRGQSHRFASPILIDDLARLLWVSHERDLQGLYHMAGAERVSLARFAYELAMAFDLTTRHDVREARGFETPSPMAETSLATLRACQAIERPMPMLRDGLAKLAKQKRTDCVFTPFPNRLEFDRMDQGTHAIRGSQHTSSSG